MDKKLETLTINLGKFLGIAPYPIKFEDIEFDSKLYYEKEYIGINNKHKDNYNECAKLIAHEFRHLFQLCYMQFMPDDIKDAWSNDFYNLFDKENKDYKPKALELDALAFTKYYLDKYENIKVVNNCKDCEEKISEYIVNNKSILEFKK